MPKISIVLPTYNGERFLEQSIESVINQTFTDWELIIVNDCSTDTTPQIIEKYVEKDTRIRVIHNVVNQKLPRSLNIGFEEAVGEYLTWTSDDNYYYPNALEEMSRYLDEHEENPMVCAKMDYIDEDNNELNIDMNYDEESMLFVNCLGACFLYRKSVLELIGGYDTSLFLVEDYDYWLRILFEIGKIGFISYRLYAYRFQPNSLTSQRQREINEKRIDLLINIWQKYKPYVTRRLDLLCIFYIECLAHKKQASYLSDYSKMMIPELEGLRPINKNGKVYIYGAGFFGELAYDKLGECVQGFVDRSAAKVGTKKKNLSIISLDEFKKREGSQLVVALGKEKLYEAIIDLYKKGIENYSVYQLLEE